MKIRLTVAGKTLVSFYADDMLSAKKEAKTKAVLHLQNFTKPSKVVFQKYNQLIQDWVSFGELKGFL